MSKFVPAYHFDDPKTKLTPEWAMKGINDCYYNTNNVSLLDGKDVNEIDQFASGNFPMARFKRMFLSIKKAMETSKDMNAQPTNYLINKADKTGLSWRPLPLIPTRLNSAVATVHKIPIEAACRAQDALAMKKKKEDIDFLKNKPAIESDLQDIADQLQIGKVDLGETKNSSKNYSEAPMGLDLTQPDDERIFSQMVYSLRVETAFEQGLQQFYNLKKGDQVKLLEIIDHFKYGVGVNWNYTSSMTGLPELEHVFPGSIRTPISHLPDYSDNKHRIYDMEVTVLELFNYFSDEICDYENLARIINGPKGQGEYTGGYCACNGKSAVEEKNWGTFKIQLKYIEIKSIDWVGVYEKQDTDGKTSKVFTDDPEKCTSKIWAQNTYGFWWLPKTKHVFGIHKLGYSYRTKGQESYQNFSTNIFKSQKTSAVELSIGENIKAQIADIKMEHAIIQSLPSGKYVDLRFLRGALDGLKNENNEYTLQDILNMAFEKNIIIGDTEDFEGPNAAQFKPFIDIPGGLKTEVAGYIQIILNADRNIANFTGINEQLTGQSANPEMLVGIQKLLINSSINAIHYCNIGISSNYKALFNSWGYLIQECIKKGGKPKETIIEMIGKDDVDMIKGLDESPLHDLTITVDISQREIERQLYTNQLESLKQKGVISAADEYMLSSIQNPRERFAYLAMVENRFMRKEEQKAQRQFENQQTIVEKQGQNMVATKEAEKQGELQEVYAKGEVEAKLLALTHKLGMSEKEADAIISRALQQDRNQAQTRKNVITIQAKEQAEATKPIV